MNIAHQLYTEEDEELNYRDVAGFEIVGGEGRLVDPDNIVAQLLKGYAPDGGHTGGAPAEVYIFDIFGAGEYEPGEEKGEDEGKLRRRQTSSTPLFYFFILKNFVKCG